jgi:hypothetical protein
MCVRRYCRRPLVVRKLILTDEAGCSPTCSYVQLYGCTGPMRTYDQCTVRSVRNTDGMACQVQTRSSAPFTLRSSKLPRPVPRSAVPVPAATRRHARSSRIQGQRREPTQQALPVGTQGPVLPCAGAPLGHGRRGWAARSAAPAPG